MGALTEIEVTDCLSENFKRAASHCDDLARLPAKGPTYKAFRDELKLIEGAARQMAYLRGGDARWLQIGLMMAEAHRRAGDWLRGIKQPNGGRRPIPPGQMHPLFVKLAENLRAGHRSAEDLRTKRTGRAGPILPRALAAAHRDTRPVGWRQSAGGVLIPAGAGA